MYKKKQKKQKKNKAIIKSLWTPYEYFYLVSNKQSNTSLRKVLKNDTQTFIKEFKQTAV